MVIAYSVSGFWLRLFLFCNGQLTLNPPPLMLAVWPLLNFFMTLFIASGDCLLCSRFSAAPVGLRRN
jgi:hypothetical protein